MSFFIRVLHIVKIHQLSSERDLLSAQKLRWAGIDTQLFAFICCDLIDMHAIGLDRWDS